MSMSVSNPASSVSDASQQREIYLQTLARSVKAGVPEALALPQLRDRTETLLKEHTFPSTRQEDWRFTDLSAMRAVPFTVSTATAQAAPESLTATHLPEATARLVLVNGRCSEALSDINGLPEGVIVDSLTNLLKGPLAESIMARLAQSAGGQEVFTALNTLGFQDVAVIWVPQDIAVAAPIQVVYLSVTDGEPLMASPRCLAIAGQGSSLTLVEDFWGTANQAYCTNSVTEIWADRSAQVTHIRLQREAEATFHLGKTAVTQAQDSRYAGVALGLGGQLMRHHLEVYQTGPQTNTALYGLSAIAGSQLSDTHSLIALNYPHGTAEQLHKAIVDDRAHAVFNGKIWVPQPAQHTDASQLNRNLLLSSTAKVDTKPELDIVANNVKCAHGATVSQLDDSEVFYLQSRGISAEMARRLLIYGFAMEVVDHIPIASVRKALAETVTQWARPSC